MRRRTLVALATVAAAIAALAGVQLGSGGQQATAAATECQLSAGSSAIHWICSS